MSFRQIDFMKSKFQTLRTLNNNSKISQECYVNDLIVRVFFVIFYVNRIKETTKN